MLEIILVKYSVFTSDRVGNVGQTCKQIKLQIVIIF